MNQLLLLFEYIHYRVYKFFEGKGDNISEFTATLVLSIIQCLTLLDILVITRIFYEFPLPEKIFILPIIFISGAINWYLYERNFDIEKLENRWGGEDKKKQIRNGWLIGLYLLLSFLVPVISGILEHNLNLI